MYRFRLSFRRTLAAPQSLPFRTFLASRCLRSALVGGVVILAAVLQAAPPSKSPRRLSPPVPKPSEDIRPVDTASPKPPDTPTVQPAPPPTNTPPSASPVSGPPQGEPQPAPITEKPSAPSLEQPAPASKSPTRSAPARPEPWETTQWTGTVPHEPTVLTLEQALARGRQLSFDNLSSMAAWDRQIAAQMQYRGQMLPRISLSGSADWRQDSLIDRSPSELLFPPSQQTRIANGAYNFQAEARQTAFSGFALLNRYRQQVLRTRGARASIEDIRQRVDSLVKQLFASVLFRQQMVADRKQSVQAFTQALEIARAREKAGESTTLDLLRAQTELRNAEAQQVEAQTDLIQGEQSLRRLLRLPLPESPEAEHLQLVGALEERPFTLSLPDVKARALELRKDYLAAKLQSDSAKRGVLAARGSFLPTVDTFANYSWRSSYYDVNRELRGWSFGLVASFSVFDGAQRLGAVRAELADARTADLHLKELQFQILSQLGELFATFQQSRASIALHRSSVELGTRGLEQARRMYQIGQIDLEELINAQLALQRAQDSLARALLENNVAVAQLEYASGDWPQ